MQNKVMQPFRAPRPVQDKSRVELGMGVIDKGIPGAKDKNKDQTQLHDSPNKTVSEPIQDMPVDKVGQKKNDDNDIPNPWWPAEEENNAQPSEASSPHLSEFEDYL